MDQCSISNVQVKMNSPGLDAAGYRNSLDAGGAAFLPFPILAHPEDSPYLETLPILTILFILSKKSED